MTYNYIQLLRPTETWLEVETYSLSDKDISKIVYLSIWIIHVLVLEHKQRKILVWNKRV